MKIVVPLLIALMALLGSACTLDISASGDAEIASDSSELLPGLGADSSGSSLRWNKMTWNKMTWNKMTWNKMTWNKMTPGQQRWHEVRSESLVGAPLSSAGIDPRFTEALTDPDVRYVFEYIVGCALPDDAAVTYTDDDGAQWTFSGLLGMAPRWQDEAACDTSCQRWVSACVYGRINYYGQRNVMSWRIAESIPGNPHVAGMEDPSWDEDASFELEEGAVWGNLFLEEAELWVCRGTDTVADLTLAGVNLGIFNGQVPMGAIRMCAGDQECLDNVSAGSCWADADRVCQNRRSENGGYSQCAAPGGPVYDEVITIRRADFAFHADFVPGAGLDPRLSSCAAKAADECHDDWDAECVDSYAMEGARWGGCNESSLILDRHSPRVTGAPLARDGSTCTAYVCAIDGSCCDLLGGWWDQTCADMATTLCQ